MNKILKKQLISDIFKTIFIPIHKEGFRFILIFAFSTILLALFSDFLGTIGLVLTLWCIFFFRDPDRFTPEIENAVISPADGIVTLIEEDVIAPESLKIPKNKKWKKVSVFLNVFNIHVNRIPISGTISKIEYKKGKFLSATGNNSSNENEQNNVIVKTKSGTEIIFSQIAGMLARRIICDLKKGQNVKSGDRYGIIRFGSRVDIYLPKSAKINVLEGQIMIGGETIIGNL